MEEIKITLEYAKCYTNLSKVSRVFRNAGGFYCTTESNSLYSCIHLLNYPIPP
ncbi:hypothetical protein PAHAL_3G460800 [Panicum hallii]|uniref:Uncharacterized protein n=1 Tax=Panicum hallii TaxID=206008 RepID=A0A2T8KLI1_9POAL|nr:hypothetical protein PAHAL_3G460800 [Panicum hallii]